MITRFRVRQIVHDVRVEVDERRAGATLRSLGPAQAVFGAIGDSVIGVVSIVSSVPSQLRETRVNERSDAAARCRV